QPPLTPTLFPYTTLFRSVHIHQSADALFLPNDLAAYSGVELLRLETAAGGIELLDRSFHGAVLLPKPLAGQRVARARGLRVSGRSEEHTSELQSPCNLVC